MPQPQIADKHHENFAVDALGPPRDSQDARQSDDATPSFPGRFNLRRSTVMHLQSWPGADHVINQRTDDPRTNRVVSGLIACPLTQSPPRPGVMGSVGA